MLRSGAGAQRLCQARPVPRSCLSQPLLRAPAPCHSAKAKDNDGVYEPSGYRRFASHAVSSAASVPSDYALCSHRKSDESTEHSQSGRQALAYTGRRSLVAVAGSGFSTLPSSCHVAGALVGGTRSAGAVSSAVAMVASVRLALLAHHRLGAVIAPARVAGVSPLPPHARAPKRTRPHRADASAWSGTGASTEPAPDAQTVGPVRPAHDD